MQKAVAVAVCLLFAVPLLAADAAKRVARNGVSVVVPKGWTVLEPEEREKRKIETNLADPSLERRADDPEAKPLMTVTKMAAKKDAVLTATVTIGRMPLPADVRALPLEKFGEAFSSQMAAAFQDFVMEKPMAATKLGGEPAIEWTYRYTALQPDGGKFAVRTHMAILEKGNDAILIGYAGPVEGPDEASAAADEMIRTFAFEKP